MPDTCQTISKGVGGFRFEDLRSMFFEERQQQLSAESPRGRIFEGDPRLVNTPPLMQLGTNYRSHNGILRCANVLVSLLVELFPSSVDRMRLEESKNPGDAPMLLPDVTPVELFMLIHGGSQSSASAEFGANQVSYVGIHIYIIIHIYDWEPSSASAEFGANQVFALACSLAPVHVWSCESVCAHVHAIRT